MPSSAQTQSARRLAFTFAAAAALLWLIGVLAPHSLLFPSGPTFADVSVYKGRFTLFHTAKFFASRKYSAFAYPAGCAVIYDALFHTANAVRTYLYFAAAATLTCFAIAIVLLRRAALSGLFAPLLLLSFPWVFLLQRANVELFLFALVGAGVLAYRRGWLYPAAVLFGLAAACKLYPIFLLGLFLKRRHDLRAFAAGVLTFLLALAAATAYAGPTFLVAAHGFSSGVSHFQDHYVETVRSAEIRFDHCLFSPLKYWSARTHGPDAVELDRWMRPYYFIAGAVAGLLFVRVRTMPFLNRVVFLTAAMVGLPPVSYSYTLIHLYLPALLLLTTALRKDSRTLLLTLATMFFLFLPLVALSAFAALPIGAIQACAVFVLLLLPLLQPWPSRTPAD